MALEHWDMVDCCPKQTIIYVSCVPKLKHRTFHLKRSNKFSRYYLQFKCFSALKPAEMIYLPRPGKCQQALTPQIIIKWLCLLFAHRFIAVSSCHKFCKFALLIVTINPIEPRTVSNDCQNGDHHGGRRDERWITRHYRISTWCLNSEQWARLWEIQLKFRTTH